MLLLPTAARLARSGRNLILRRLSSSDLGLIEPHLSDVVVEDGQTMLMPGDAISVIHFPESAVVALADGTGRRPHIEVALVGYEGFIGWPALLGCTHSVHRATVEMQSGRVRSIGVEELTAACRMSPTLWAALLTFVQTVNSQMANAIVAHLGSSLDRRIARWLLMRHDRLGGDQLFVRHDQIAAALNARRASITHRLHLLEGQQLIRNKRGRIDIQDRNGLETFAADAYGICEADYSRLIARFGKSAHEIPATSSLQPW